jgi:Zn-dependent alcohol dehydrogenase
MAGKIEIDPMITHVMGLEDINKGSTSCMRAKASAASSFSKSLT